MMFANTRRQAAIVAARLLVLLLSAGRQVEMRRAQAAGNGARCPPEDASVSAVGRRRAAMQDHAETMARSGAAPADVQPNETVGVVDARNCGNPKYKNLMYGEIAVRWIWNGHKLVPQKVCIVDEGNGVSSVWSFDQNNGVTVSEIQEPVAASR
jgi:hypothetical protein